MALGQYDEDNRDAIEERYVSQGGFNPSVFNYTCDHTIERQSALRSRRRNKAYAKALAAYYANHFGTPDDEEV